MGGSTPHGVGVESGFEEDSIYVDGSDSALASASESAPVYTPNSTKYKEKKREMQIINQNLESSNKCLEAIGDVTTTLKEIMKDRKQKKNEVDNTDYVDKLCALDEQKRKIKDSSFFSPNTKKAMYTSITFKKKKISDQLKEEIK